MKRTTQSSTRCSRLTFARALVLIGLFGHAIHTSGSCTTCTVQRDTTVKDLLVSGFLGEAKTLWTSHTYVDFGLGAGLYTGNWIHFETTWGEDAATLPTNYVAGLAVNVRKNFAQLSRTSMLGLEVPLLVGAGWQDDNWELAIVDKSDNYIAGTVGLVPSVFFGTHAQFKPLDTEANAVSRKGRIPGVGFSFGVGPQLVVGRRFSPAREWTGILESPDELRPAAVYFTGAFGIIFGGRNEETASPPIRLRVALSTLPREENLEGEEQRVRSFLSLIYTAWL